jgi:predicted transcriptional regulator
MREKIQAIVDLGIMKSRIAKDVGISQPMMNQWLNGNRELGEANYQKMVAWYEDFKKRVEKIL